MYCWEYKIRFHWSSRVFMAIPNPTYKLLFSQLRTFQSGTFLRHETSLRSTRTPVTKLVVSWKMSNIRGNITTLGINSTPRGSVHFIGFIMNFFPSRFRSERRLHRRFYWVSDKKVCTVSVHLGVNFLISQQFSKSVLRKTVLTVRDDVDTRVLDDYLI